jgi:Zn-dependent peptidase ImmA (M78 family)
MSDRSHRAEVLLHSLGITEPSEIDVEAIAYHCGCVVKYRTLDGCAARIIGVGDKAVISVDKSSPRGRQRFSIGHELGHWISDRGAVLFECDKANLRKPWSRELNPEDRANEFAANLLLPAYLLTPCLEKQPLTFKAVNDVAGHFTVSRTAAAIRVVELGTSPAMLICHSKRGREWFAASPGVEGHLWPFDQLSPDTDAYEILHGGLGSGRSQMVDADDWIDHHGAEDYVVQEHSVAAGSVVLSLLWWKDTSMIEDLVA